MVESDQIYDFLAGLNKGLDDVRGRLLGIKPLPQIEEIFVEIRREECRRRVTLGGSTIRPLKPQHWLLVVQITVLSPEGIKNGVTIVRNQTTPKIPVGNCMANPLDSKPISWP
ncbi:hypothetical protein CK203_035972 [Vitis vinifera]|uniref:Uncharacterized protein n=1 Tax=Vitis vinifera TaxID=29760 RepID=A0A438I080_VITVI|nr:hypothetical protein CK203_035972 [Vitis vinifera]